MEIRKQQGSVKEINVIILSTSNDPANIEKTLELGPRLCSKPNRFDVRKSFLEDVLRIDLEITKKHKKIRLI